MTDSAKNLCVRGNCITMQEDIPKAAPNGYTAVELAIRLLLR